MKNELGRKITSLTLMTIMFAGGMTFAIPEMMPEAAADERLMYVSAESELFGNTFAGGQVVEIIVRDPARDETDESQSEPTVEINDEIVRMLQGEDGYWYAYIASTNAVADNHAVTNYDYGTAQAAGLGPELCNNGGTCNDANLGTLTISPTAVIYINDDSTLSANSGNTAAPSLSQFGTHSAGTLKTGQLNITSAEWPFTQTWEFTDDSDVTITFEKPGPDEVVVLNFETDGTGLEDYAYMELDRNDAPAGASIFMTIYDQQLNFDPTAVDTVAFLTNSTNFTAGTTWDYTMSNNASLAYVSSPMAHFGDNGKLKIDVNATGGGAIITTQNNADCVTSTLVTGELTGNSGYSGYHCFTETAANSGIFTNGDDADKSTMIVSSTAKRGYTATFDYNDAAQTLQVKNWAATIDMAEDEAGDEWNSGEEITVTLVDPDRNLTSASDEDLTVATTDNVPSIKIGNPLGVVQGSTAGNVTVSKVEGTSGIATFKNDADLVEGTDHDDGPIWTIDSGLTGANVNAMNTTAKEGGGSVVERYVFVDMSSMCVDGTVVVAGVGSISGATITNGQTNKGVISYGTADVSDAQTDLSCRILGETAGTFIAEESVTGHWTFAAFGASDNHAHYRIEVEETDDNTGVFVGGVEFIMLNQNTIDEAVASSITATSDSVTMLLPADLTGTDAPRVKYNDTDSEGIFTGVADQVDAPTHSGTVAFDQESYKIADTVTITVTDMDLNADSELIDVYITQNGNDMVDDADDTSLDKHVLDVYFGDAIFDDACEGTAGTQIASTGLESTGFQLVETDVASGIFTGTFQIPSEVCNSTAKRDSTGLDIFTNYWDFTDAGGNTIETGSAATVAANSGSVSLDQSVYPVPYMNTAAQFSDHSDTLVGWGNVTVTIAVTDPDHDQSPVGEDTILATAGKSGGASVGLVWVEAVRGSTTATLASNFALTETEATSGVFEYEFTLNATSQASLGATALRQGDVITATYNDTNDAAGKPYITTDSSTLDLRTGSLLSDKSVYVIGSDAIITIVDADLNRDGGTIESYTLNLIEWDSDAGTVELGEADTAFDAEPSAFRETGEDTGIFQTVIEMPAKVGLTAGSLTTVDQGEKIDLEYVDYGPSGENYYGDDTSDVGLTIYTSNFGATIELDSKVYTWTDRVFVTIVAPDHNKDTSLVDEIGGSGKTLTAQTRDGKLTAYKMVETGVDTGIFWGEITLQGFAHDADGDGTSDSVIGTASAASAGPTDGILKSSESDGITVSFEYTEDSTVVQSALIRWNIGETSFSEDSYLSSSSAVVTVVDPDMNRNPDSTENFSVDVYSDSDSGGISLTVTETNESTGVFEGTVFFTTEDASGGHTLRVSEGDSITAEYSDHTLPSPYSTSDDIDVSATAVIGTSTPPLERAPVANARVVDAFGNSLAEVSVDQQVQIEADLVNGQDGDQSFAYLVQVQDSDGVTVSLAWITGQLSAGQSFSPALSWIPSASGSYEATVFVWESVDNPTALSDTASVSITVV